MVFPYTNLMVATNKVQEAVVANAAMTIAMQLSGLPVPDLKLGQKPEPAKSQPSPVIPAINEKAPSADHIIQNAASFTVLLFDVLNGRLTADKIENADTRKLVEETLKAAEGKKGAEQRAAIIDSLKTAHPVEAAFVSTYTKKKDAALVSGETLGGIEKDYVTHQAGGSNSPSWLKEYAKAEVGVEGVKATQANARVIGLRDAVNDPEVKKAAEAAAKEAAAKAETKTEVKTEPPKVEPAKTEPPKPAERALEGFHNRKDDFSLEQVGFGFSKDANRLGEFLKNDFSKENVIVLYDRTPGLGRHQVIQYKKDANGMFVPEKLGSKDIPIHNAEFNKSLTADEMAKLVVRQTELGAQKKRIDLGNGNSMPVSEVKIGGNFYKDALERMQNVNFNIGPKVEWKPGQMEGLLKDIPAGGTAKFMQWTSDSNFIINTFAKDKDGKFTQMINGEAKGGAMDVSAVVARADNMKLPAQLMAPPKPSYAGLGETVGFYTERNQFSRGLDLDRWGRVTPLNNFASALHSDPNLKDQLTHNFGGNRQDAVVTETNKQLETVGLVGGKPVPFKPVVMGGLPPETELQAQVTVRPTGAALN